MEDWRSTHHPDYEVSNLGRVRSYRPAGSGHNRRIVPRILKPGLQSRGYPTVVVYYRTYLVHRLVAVAFHGPCPLNQEVRHKDDNKQNPRADNLCYGTSQQNKQDAIEHRLILRGEVHPSSKLTENEVREIRSLLGTLSHTKLAKRFGVFHTTISAIAKRRSWAHV